MCVPSVSTLDLVKFTWNCTRVLYEYYEYYDLDKIERYRIWSVNRTLNVSSTRGEGQLELTEVWWTLTNSEVLDVGIKFSSSNPIVRRGVWPSALCRKVNVRWRTSDVSSVQKLPAGRFTTHFRCCRRYCCSACCCYHKILLYDMHYDSSFFASWRYQVAVDHNNGIIFVTHWFSDNRNYKAQRHGTNFSHAGVKLLVIDAAFQPSPRAVL